jgi:hypothetical protein
MKVATLLAVFCMSFAIESKENMPSDFHNGGVFLSSEPSETSDFETKKNAGFCFFSILDTFN